MKVSTVILLQHKVCSRVLARSQEPVILRWLNTLFWQSLHFLSSKNNVDFKLCHVWFPFFLQPSSKMASACCCKFLFLLQISTRTLLKIQWKPALQTPGYCRQFRLSRKAHTFSLKLTRLYGHWLIWTLWRVPLVSVLTGFNFKFQDRTLFFCHYKCNLVNLCFMCCCFQTGSFVFVQFSASQVGGASFVHCDLLPVEDDHGKIKKLVKYFQEKNWVRLLTLFKTIDSNQFVYILPHVYI